MLDWFLVAQIGVRAHVTFPNFSLLPNLLPVSTVSYALIGIALLHGVLINRLNSQAGRKLQTLIYAGKCRHWARQSSGEHWC